jgi:hypothetical protein
MGNLHHQLDLLRRNIFSFAARRDGRLACCVPACISLILSPSLACARRRRASFWSTVHRCVDQSTEGNEPI